MVSVMLLLLYWLYGSPFRLFYGVGALGSVLPLGVVGVFLFIIVASISTLGCVLGSIVCLVSRRSVCPPPSGVVPVYLGKYTLYLWVRNSVSMPLLASGRVPVLLALRVSILSILSVRSVCMLGRSCRIWAYFASIP